jgi:hypothetical protein
MLIIGPGPHRMAQQKHFRRAQSVTPMHPAPPASSTGLGFARPLPRSRTAQAAGERGPQSRPQTLDNARFGKGNARKFKCPFAVFDVRNRIQTARCAILKISMSEAAVGFRSLPPPPRHSPSNDGRPLGRAMGRGGGMGPRAARRRFKLLLAAPLTPTSRQAEAT